MRSDSSLKVASRKSPRLVIRADGGTFVLVVAVRRLEVVGERPAFAHPVYRSTQESGSRVYPALRRGAHFQGVGDLRGISVAQLGFSLKVLTAGQKRRDRFGRRMDRLDRKSPKGNVEQH